MYVLKRAEEGKQERQEARTNEPDSTFHERADVEVVCLHGAISTAPFALPPRFDFMEQWGTGWRSDIQSPRKRP